VSSYCQVIASGNTSEKRYFWEVLPDAITLNGPTITFFMVRKVIVMSYHQVIALEEQASDNPQERK
jgi:hypothetical protein